MVRSEKILKIEIELCFYSLLLCFFLKTLKIQNTLNKEAVIVQTFFGLNKFLHSTEKGVCLEYM